MDEARKELLAAMRAIQEKYDLRPSEIVCLAVKALAEIAPADVTSP